MRRLEEVLTAFETDSETVKAGAGTPRVSTYTRGANDNRLSSISVGGTAQRRFEHTPNGAIGNDIASWATQSFYYDLRWPGLFEQCGAGL